jgi:hypothetical protein
MSVAVPNSRARIPAETLLIDDDCRREIRENVEVRLTVARQKILHERRERLIEQTLGFRGDRVEHQRALPAPETPVNTVICRRGMSSEMFLRLFSRAPRTSMLPNGEPIK